MPGSVRLAPVRLAAAFIDAHADRHITLDEIARAAGVTGRALQYAFRRHYATTPTGYLRQVRLDRARDDLLAAVPGDGMTVAVVARTWGWANSAHFAAAYRRRFGQRPSHALRA
jgi:transcriptional regulator GlxA family with amidase domain